MSYLIMLSVTRTAGPVRNISNRFAARGAVRAVPLFFTAAADSLASGSHDPKSARTCRRTARIHLSLRSRTAWPAPHVCPLLPESTPAGQRSPRQTTAHPGRELSREPARHRGLKLNENQPRI